MGLNLKNYNNLEKLVNENENHRHSYFFTLDKSTNELIKHFMQDEPLPEGLTQEDREEEQFRRALLKAFDPRLKNPFLHHSNPEGYEGFSLHELIHKASDGSSFKELSKLVDFLTTNSLLLDHPNSNEVVSLVRNTNVADKNNIDAFIEQISFLEEYKLQPSMKKILFIAKDLPQDDVNYYLSFSTPTLQVKPMTLRSVRSQKERIIEYDMVLLTPELERNIRNLKVRQKGLRSYASCLYSYLFGEIPKTLDSLFLEDIPFQRFVKTYDELMSQFRNRGVRAKISRSRNYDLAFNIIKNGKYNLVNVDSDFRGDNNGQIMDALDSIYYLKRESPSANFYLLFEGGRELSAIKLKKFLDIQQRSNFSTRFLQDGDKSSLFHSFVNHASNATVIGMENLPLSRKLESFDISPSSRLYVDLLEESINQLKSKIYVKREAVELFFKLISRYLDGSVSKDEVNDLFDARFGSSIDDVVSHIPEQHTNDQYVAGKKDVLGINEFISGYYLLQFVNTDAVKNLTIMNTLRKDLERYGIMFPELYGSWITPEKKVGFGLIKELTGERYVDKLRRGEMSKGEIKTLFSLVLRDNAIIEHKVENYEKSYGRFEFKRLNLSKLVNSTVREAVDIFNLDFGAKKVRKLTKPILDFLNVLNQQKYKFIKRDPNLTHYFNEGGTNQQIDWDKIDQLTYSQENIAQLILYVPGALTVNEKSFYESLGVLHRLSVGKRDSVDQSELEKTIQLFNSSDPSKGAPVDINEQYSTVDEVKEYFASKNRAYALRTFRCAVNRATRYVKLCKTNFKKLRGKNLTFFDLKQSVQDYKASDDKRKCTLTKVYVDRFDVIEDDIKNYLHEAISYVTQERDSKAKKSFLKLLGSIKKRLDT